MTEPATQFTVMGAGSWGTTLAMLLASNGHPAQLWAHRQQHAEQLRRDNRNERYLPGITFPKFLTVVDDVKTSLEQTDIILIVVPSHGFRDACKYIAPLLKPHHKLAWASKGLEPKTHKLLHQIVAEELPPSLATAVISGPTFAKEVAQGLPGAVTVASKDPDYAYQLAKLLHNHHFRAYTGKDIIGVEVGGAVKNVLAIAAGIADGMGFGANTRAALIARGVAEMMRLGVKLGAQQGTFIGLTGLGDLVLTCSDNLSRNRRMGLALGQGKTEQQAHDEIKQVVEGINTAREVYNLAQQHHIDMPLTEHVYKVLHEGMNLKFAVQELMERAIRAEVDE